MGNSTTAKKKPTAPAKPANPLKKVLAKKPAATSSKIKTITITDKTTIKELASQAGLKTGTLVTELFQHGNTTTISQTVTSMTDALKVVNAVGKKHGFKAVVGLTAGVRVAEKTTYAELAEMARLPVAKLLTAMKDAGYTVLAEDRVRGVIPHRSVVRTVLRGLGVQVVFQKVDPAGMMTNSNFNMTPVERRFPRKPKTDTNADTLVEAYEGATRNRRTKKAAKKAGTSKVVKKTSSNTSGLTVRELENEIFKIDGLRVVIRASDSLRTGAAKYGKRLAKGALMEDLTARLDRYFRKSKHAEELVGVQFAVVDAKGKAHYNTLSPKKALSEARF